MDWFNIDLAALIPVSSTPFDRGVLMYVQNRG